MSTRFAHVVKAGRTHLMDATPVTLGQEADAWAGMLAGALARSRADIDALGELPLGGTAVGTGINASAVVRAGRHRLAGRRDRAAAAPERQPDGAAGRAGRAVGRLGRAARHRRRPHQDRQRHPAAGQRAVRRARRAAAARAAGRLVDHAGQGQPGAVRGGQPGRGARVRQRPHRRLRRVAGHPRAQHVPAGDGRRPVRVGHAARQRVPAVRASDASPASRPTRSAAASTPRSRARWPPR